MTGSQQPAGGGTAGAVTAPGTAGRGAVASTCFKCGKSGHWARDCRANPSERINSSRPNNTQTGEQQRQGQQSAEASQQPGADRQETAKLKAKRPDRKLTWERMTGKGGIGYVYATFPATFRKQFKGRGHETGDLGRLIRLFEGWQRQVFPAAKSFDTFVSEVERFSSSSTVKGELRDMRRNVLKLAGMNIDSAALGALIGSIPRSGAVAGADGGGDGFAGNAGVDEGLDADELAELQSAPAEGDAAPSDVHTFGYGGNNPSATATAAVDELDDEELAALHGDDDGAGDGELDDEELADLQDEMLGF